MLDKDQVSNDDLANDGIDGKQKDVVSHESFQKLLNQRKADKEKFTAMEAKLKDLESKEAEIARKEAELNEQKLREDGNWKALLESREARAKELEEKNKDLSETVKSFEEKFTNAHKLNAFKEAIGGTLKQTEYYNFVDTSKIALDPETGIIDDKSLKSYANEFITKHNALINFKNTVKLPNGAAAAGGATLSHDEWTKLAQANPEEARKRMKDVK